MSYKQHSFAREADSNIYSPEDDIDTLFAQLQQIEPPPSLIAHILAQVSQNTIAPPILLQPWPQNEIEAWTI